MERPAKRQKLSNIETISYQQYSSSSVSSLNNLIGFSTPSRTLNLADFQRPSLIFEPQNYSKPPQRRRSPGRVVLPRAPDVTVTTGVLEVAVNDGSTSTQIAVPTTDVAVSLNSLGTLTVPAQTTSSGPSGSSVSGSAPISDSNSSSVSSSGSNIGSGSSDLTSTARNTTTLLSSVTERTATVTATSTFHVSYINGTFIAATSTRQSGTSVTSSNGLNHISTITSSSTRGRFSFDPDQTGTSDTVGVPTSGDNSASISATATGSGPHGSSASGSTAAGGGGGGGDSGGSSGPALTPQQTQMVGGIVGGLAGIALIAFAILYVLRWYRQRLTSKTGLKRLVDFDPAHDHGKSELVNTVTTMSSTSHSSFFPTASSFITSSKHWRTGFETVNRSGTIPPESEKGFQRIAGRKIPPVLSTGGDQYGDSQSSFHNSSSVFDEKVGVAISTPTRQEMFSNRSNQRVLSDASVYSDYEGMYANNNSNSISNHYQHNESFSEPTTPIYGGALLHHNGSTDRLRRPPLSHTRSYQDIALEDLSRALTADVNRPDGFAVIRNSPARTPVTQSPTASSIALPVHAPVSMDEDIPEMPLTPLSSGNTAVAAYGLGLGHDLLARRIPSRVSARSNSSSGRFREELA